MEILDPCSFDSGPFSDTAREVQVLGRVHAKLHTLYLLLSNQINTQNLDSDGYKK
jgi:hypothetical protein